VSNRPNPTAPKPASSSSGSRTPVWVWIGIAAVVVVALGTALLLSTSGNSNALTIGEDVKATGSALPALQAGGPDPAVGRPAPKVSGVDFAGQPIEIGPDGTPKVLVFLAHWCPVCQREVPVIVGWAEGGGSTEGVEVIGIATGIDRTRGNWPPGAWLRSDRWPYPTLVDDAENRAGTAFGLTSFPYFVVIDASGNVVERVSGEIGASAFAGLVEAARTGVPSTPVPGGESTPVELQP
jgi:thiol-disulfide isomerase/thioredoxin